MQPAAGDVLLPPMMEEIPMPAVEVEAKATGILVTPTRALPPVEAESEMPPASAASGTCTDVAPDNVYTCAEQVTPLLLYFTSKCGRCCLEIVWKVRCRIFGERQLLRQNMRPRSLSSSPGRDSLHRHAARI